MIKEVFSYQGVTEMFLDFMSGPMSQNALCAESWLCEFDESTLSEAERLNIILLPIKWCAEHNEMSEWFRNELWLYYESYLNGTLEKEYADYIGEDDEGHDLEKDKELVFRDLVETYKLVFGTEKLVDDL